MNDRDFLDYCKIHNETERALFSGRDVMRLARLARETLELKPEGFYTMKEIVADYIREAEKKLDSEESKPFDPGDTRRLKLLIIDPEHLRDMLNPQEGYIHQVSYPGLPEGVKVVNVCYSVDHHGIVMTLAHPSFDKIPVGEMLPLCEGARIDVLFLKKEKISQREPRVRL